jgi:hypothetical protein
MTAEELALHLKQQPFVPFRVRLDNGERREITHPKWVWLYPDIIFLAYPDPVLPWPAIDRYETIAVTRVQAVEQVSEAA